MSKDKSQKRKNNNINRTELWNIFDSEVERPDKRQFHLNVCMVPVIEKVANGARVV